MSLTHLVSEEDTSSGFVLSPEAVLIPENGRLNLRPFRIVSLREMYEFGAREFFAVINKLISIRKDLEERGHPALTADEQSNMHGHLDNAYSACGMYDIDVSYYTERVRRKIDNPDGFTYTVASAVDAVRHCIVEKLQDRMFLYMPAADAKYFDRVSLFGEEVDASFPEAEEDIRAAGNCIACGLYTASVFHLMRVAEFGLRNIAASLKVQIKDRGKVVPVEYGTWDKVITACKNKIDRIKRRPIGPKRQSELEFYADAADHCVFMKDIWRNTVSHTRKPYNRPEALAVLERVKDFTKFIAAMSD